MANFHLNEVEHAQNLRKPRLPLQSFEYFDVEL